MKTTRYLAVILGILLAQGVASAEAIFGTVTNIDMSGQKITVLRTDNNKSITVHVKDANQLASLKTGAQVNLDANKKILGRWEANSLDATEGPSAGAADQDMNSPSLGNGGSNPSSQTAPSQAQD